MDDEVRTALEELAVWAAVNVGHAPGRLEKRLVLMNAFAEADRITEAAIGKPDLALLDALLDEPEMLIPNLQRLWIGDDDVCSR
ncbi:MAG TPA: hypothetical protein VNK46_16055 [Nitrospiraceae bacterium]|jgi:hypothetical protein|nr:hypothetical protein [Nitrospiraceae bacterium]